MDRGFTHSTAFMNSVAFCVHPFFDDGCDGDDDDFHSGDAARDLCLGFRYLAQCLLSGASSSP